MNPETAPLPRIIRFRETIDAPDSSCPHCGATGRYILRFVVEDGRELGAMRGCVKLFPVSQAAIEDLRLQEKAKRYAKNGWKLNRLDQAAVDALQAFFNGAISEVQALGAVKAAKHSNQLRAHTRAAYR